MGELLQVLDARGEPRVPESQASSATHYCTVRAKHSAMIHPSKRIGTWRTALVLWHHTPTYIKYIRANMYMLSKVEESSHVVIMLAVWQIFWKYDNLDETISIHALQLCHNERDGVSNHRRHYCIRRFTCKWMIIAYMMRNYQTWYYISFFDWPLINMTSSNGNIFRVTGPLWGESTGHRWIPLTKADDAQLWCFLWSAPEQTVE